MRDELVENPQAGWLGGVLHHIAWVGGAGLQGDTSGVCWIRNSIPHPEPVP